jgi:hypothetical protein
MERLIKLQGHKLPCEQVWVDPHQMYEVYGRITLNIDGVTSELIITEIIEEGLIVELLQ